MQLVHVWFGRHSRKLNHHAILGQGQWRDCFQSFCRAVSVKAQSYYFAVTYGQLGVLLLLVSINQLAVDQEISIAFGVGLDIENQIFRLQSFLGSGGDLIIVNVGVVVDTVVINLDNFGVTKVHLDCAVVEVDYVGHLSGAGLLDLLHNVHVGSAHILNDFLLVYLCDY
jgi:hypothetical protein